ncbi:DUF484 family protein [Arhodomonas sp. SL1]|uniref:DUF484 family protein n=1 Tax=Arhodomonas sp. SL1 TaxID=3425691 RepID=UPI003F8820D4
MTPYAENENEPERDDAEERRIAAYLAEHPRFFTRHRRLLSTLYVPHDVAPAISLLEYQVGILRDNERRLRRRLDDLLRIARENDRLSEQLHRLTLELMDAEGGEATLNTLESVLVSDFRADCVEVTLVGMEAPSLNARQLATGDNEARRLRELFRGHRPVIGRLTTEQMQAAFGDAADGLHSAAVVPLQDGPVQGLIAIGSRDPERYAGNLGTVFLERLGQIVARRLRHGLAGHG